MRIFAKKPPKPAARTTAPPPDMQSLLKPFEQQIADMVAALMNGDSAIDIKMAELMEGQPQHVRSAMIEKLREQLAQRDEQKAKALDVMIEQQRTQAQQQKMSQHWLAYFMSQETLRKIRESFMGSPGLKAQVEALGQELARKGVIGNMQMNQKQDLGELSSTILYNRNRETGKDTGKGR